MNQTLTLAPEFAAIADDLSKARDVLFLGRGQMYPIALEGALKLKEISYIHAEGYPAAEMKHGPIALIDSEMPVFVIATRNGMYEKLISNIQEVKARQGRVIALVTKGDTKIRELADEVIELPETMADWSLTSLQLKLIKIGARVVRHARTITFQLAEVAVTGTMVRAILAAIRRLRAPPLCA